MRAVGTGAVVVVRVFVAVGILAGTVSVEGLGCDIAFARWGGGPGNGLGGVDGVNRRRKNHPRHQSHCGHGPILLSAGDGEGVEQACTDTGVEVVPGPGVGDGGRNGLR